MGYQINHPGYGIDSQKFGTSQEAVRFAKSVLENEGISADIYVVPDNRILSYDTYDYSKMNFM